MIDDSDVLLAA